MPLVFLSSSLSICNQLFQPVLTRELFRPKHTLAGDRTLFPWQPHWEKKKGGMSERTDASVYVRVCAGIHLGWWFCVVLHTLFLSLNCLTLSHKTSHLHPSLLHHSLHLEYSSLSIIDSTETIPTYTLSDEAFF